MWGWFDRTKRRPTRERGYDALWATLDPQSAWIWGHRTPADPVTLIPVGCQRLLLATRTGGSGTYFPLGATLEA